MTELAFGLIACGVCEQREARWSHQLDPYRSQFRLAGKGHVWGSPVVLCDGCSELLGAADIDGLLAASAEPEPDALRALVAADLGAVGLDELRPPDYQELVDAGFVPLPNVTGADFLGAAWPPDSRRQAGSEWFIRSPWPDLDLADVFGLATRTIDDSVRAHGSGCSDVQLVADVRDLLADGAEVHRRLAR
jgi:hypothetical protein